MSSVAAPQARCEYQVTSEGARSFSASITITNTGTGVMNGWSVNWQYQGSSWLTYASGARVTGRNPYTAVGSTLIQPGQRISFSVQGVKPRRTGAEVPRVEGAICR